MCARAASAQLPAEVQRKTPRPSGANTLAQFVYPAQPVLKKAAAQKGRTRLRQFGHPAQPVLKKTATRTGAKRKGHLRFPFLFELLPFPCFLIWRRLPICDRCEKEYGRGFFLCCGRTTFGVRPLEQPVRSVRYHSATHTVYSTQARHKVNCP